MSKISTINEALIFELIEDPNYIILRSGIILTCKNKNGSISERWREAGSYWGDYVVVKYRNIKLMAHRIVYAKWHGTLDPEMVINHIDGDRTNNAIKNLEQVSSGQNLRHAYNTLNREKRVSSPMTAEMANQIREAKSNGLSLRELSLLFNKPKSTIADVCASRTFRAEVAANG